MGGAAHGALVLAVDFGRSDSTPREVETGFTEFAISGANNAIATTQTQVIGGFTVSVFPANVETGNLGASGRERGAPVDNGSFTYGSLLRDLVTRIAQGDTVGNPLVSLQISGLPVSTSYTLQLWALDNANGAGAEVSTWYDMSSGSNITLGTITNSNAAAPTSNNDFSLTATVTTDSTGTLKLGSVFPNSQGQINGFTLNTIPEPGSLVFLAMGMMSVLSRRRR